MPRHFTDTRDPVAAFELELTRAEERAKAEHQRSAHPRYDGAVERIWRMTAAERVAAMRAGELSLRQLAAWSARCPDEVPKLPVPRRPGVRVDRRHDPRVDRGLRDVTTRRREGGPVSPRALPLRDAYRDGRLVVAPSAAIPTRVRRRRDVVVIPPGGVAALMLVTPGALTDGARGRLVSPSRP